MTSTSALTCAMLSAALVSACTGSADSSLGSSSLPGSSTTPETTINYVALGDSYAAFGSANAPTTGPKSCHRATDNYPSNIMKSSKIKGTDASCGGAKTDHILAEWDRGGGELIPAQADSLRSDTELVTLSISGNDIEFGTLTDCFMDIGQHPGAATCESRLGAKTDALYAALPAKLDAVHEEIKRRSPNARVIVTGYYALATASGACPAAGSMTVSDRQWIADLTSRLNTIVSDAGSRHGAEFVLPANTDQHTVCAAPAQRWVDGTGQDTGSVPMHPTALGQKTMANAVLAKL
ncbi:SGNH/GDSL hydrolase family protein [Corynebacterium suicordis]|uniref:SGNH/GDSL hydrolase family protein n=1 Tax=Corynebacterium suicordis DSM 45110 TaxID=1121369 RepID=A0ABR9ZIT5_9CORY|nr:SGNH/GDSL hydrolase family protein [Corynebacterium suicordis]MBF4553352.1 SGNH/GDSL hydrolase family protein [Corynebacterium suicordis DSM 45110]MDR6277675.1 lysophospholipase L1-like esterase [Corynebacterium suicordis]